jgi:ubiquinone/menaquinone biosynthesis C-methylase UbiE
MTTTANSDADRALKQRHRAMWAWGDYPRLAADLINDLGPVVVQAAQIRPGQRVLDVAAGAGNATLPAAATGAQVVACDLTPELLLAGAQAAEQRGLSVEWVEADAEALPFPDADFDAVISVVGAMFAPHHQQTADEMLRVCRSGGRIAMINWTPEGFVGQLFATMRPYSPPLPPGADPAPRWGDPDHVRRLFTERVHDLSFERRALRYPPIFATAADLRDYYKACYGPTIGVYRALADDPDRVTALDRDFTQFLERSDNRSPGARHGAWSAEYLLVTATKN